MGKNWTFGQKLAVGFAAVVLLAVFMALVAYFSLQLVTTQHEEVFAHNVQNQEDAQAIHAISEGKVAAIRGYLLTQGDRHTQSMRDADAEFAATIKTLRGRKLSAEEQQEVLAMESAWEAYDSEAGSLIALSESGADQATVEKAFDERLQPKLDTLRSRVDDFVTRQKSGLDDQRKQATSTANNAIAFVVGIGVAIVLLSIVLAFFLTRGLTRQIGSAIQHVRSSSTELQTAATQQASGAKEQATAMNEITTTIGELLVTSRQIDESAQQVSRIAEDTASSAKVGGEHVRKSQDILGSIKQQVDTIVEHMLDLGKKSQQVGGILEIINELSEQTNILAINATIEAAGAGEAGRRFAVVGEEIRKLADRVGGSAKEIRNLIEEIRAAVNTTVMATETGSKTVAAGTQRFAELNESFQKIGSLVETTTDAAREIKLSTKQQTTAVEQVNVAVSNVSQASKETEASTTQTLQTASQLKTLSDDLARLVSSNHHQG